MKLHIVIMNDSTLLIFKGTLSSYENVFSEVEDKYYHIGINIKKTCFSIHHHMKRRSSQDKCALYILLNALFKYEVRFIKKKTVFCK